MCLLYLEVLTLKSIHRMHDGSQRIHERSTNIEHQCRSRICPCESLRHHRAFTIINTSIKANRLAAHPVRVVRQMIFIIVTERPSRFMVTLAWTMGKPLSLLTDPFEALVSGILPVLSSMWPGSLLIHLPIGSVHRR
jgi:hypothetical protein